MNPIRDRVNLNTVLPFSEDTGDVDDQEPEEWERQGRVQKAWRYLSLYPFLTAAGGLFLLTLFLYLYPIIPRAHSSPVFVIVAFWLLTVAGWGAHREKAAIRRLQEYDLHVSFYGNAIIPRLGKQVELRDDRLVGFKTLREFSWGGLVAKYEQFRDRFARREIGQHVNKHSRVDDDGSGDVVDGYLEGQTATADAMRNGIELFNTISVSHVGTQKTELGSKNVESRATLPPTIDSRTSSKVHRAFEKEKEGRREAEELLDMLRDHVEELEEYVDPSGKPLFQNTISLIQTMHEIETDDDQGPSPAELEIQRKMRNGDEG